MNRPTRYGVYTARFRFVESDRFKLRPLIVISQTYGRFGILVAVPVSSTSSRESIDFEIIRWREAGLKKQSVARIHRLTAIPQTDLLEKLGDLNQSDVNKLRNSLKNLFDL